MIAHLVNFHRKLQALPRRPPFKRLFFTNQKLDSRLLRRRHYKELSFILFLLLYLYHNTKIFKDIC